MRLMVSRSRTFRNIEETSTNEQEADCRSGGWYAGGAGGGAGGGDVVWPHQHGGVVCRRRRRGRWRFHGHQEHQFAFWREGVARPRQRDRKSTRLNSSHVKISY